MNETVNNWLTEKMKLPGLLACGIRCPDRRTFTRSQLPQFTSAALENACRCLSDTFHVLQSNRFATQHVRWVFEKNFYYGYMRQDGVCLGIITGREAPNLQPADLEQLIQEFQGLRP